MKLPHHLIPLAVTLSMVGAAEFQPRQVVRPFDPIVDPKIVSLKDSSDWVRDDELVLGVVIGDEVRAYPINMLTNPSREIINDKLGGKSIAATW